MSGVPTDTFTTFGPLVSNGTVRTSVLSLLQDKRAGVLNYLTPVATMNGIDPGKVALPDGPASFRSGLDFDTYQSDVFPLWIVVSTPLDPPERYGGGEYGVWFTIEVATLIRMETEPDAIEMVDVYGTATMGCVLQHGGLGGVASKTNLEGYPRVEFVSLTGPRNMVRSVLTVRAYVQPVVVERYGPPIEQTPLAPSLSVYPTVSETDVKIVTEGAPVSDSVTVRST